MSVNALIPHILPGKQFLERTERAVVDDTINELTNDVLYNQAFSIAVLSAHIIGDTLGQALGDEVKRAEKKTPTKKSEQHAFAKNTASKLDKQKQNENTKVSEAKLPHALELYYKLQSQDHDVINWFDSAQASSKTKAQIHNHYASKPETSSSQKQRDAVNGYVHYQSTQKSQVHQANVQQHASWMSKVDDGFWDGVDDIDDIGYAAHRGESDSLGITTPANLNNTSLLEKLGYFSGVLIGDTASMMGGDAAVEMASNLTEYVEKGVSKLRFFGVGKEVERFPSVLDIVQNHPLEGWTPEQVVNYVDQLGLKTPQDQLILWSGLGRGKEGITMSKEYASANGGLTLEMTRGGSWLDKMDLFGPDSPFSSQEATNIWAGVSKKLTQQASGQVRTLLGQVRPRSIYLSRELSEIKINPNVLGVDEIYLKPKFVFGNSY